MIYKYIKRSICYFMVFLVLSTTFPGNAAASDSWIETSSLPLSLASQYSLKYNGHIYSISGSASSVYQANYYSTINPDKSLSPWGNTSLSLPPLSWIAGTNINNYIYILGGVNTAVVNVNTVFLGTIDNTSGDITNWQQLSPLPQALSFGASTISENYIFYAGGNTNSSDPWGSTAQEIYKSTLNASDGKIGTWGIAGTLPEKINQFNMLSRNGYLYVFGGYTQTGAVRNNVQRAQINTDGTIGDWQNLPSLPKAVARSGITTVGDYVISAGGFDGTTNINNIYFSKFNSDGTVTDWQTSPVMLPSVNCCGELISSDDILYLIGGYTSAGYTNKVYYANAYEVLGVSQPTPFPTQTPLPVSKVFFVPGFGASWNANAFANCTFDNNPDNWSLAQYAESVYNPILTALADSGWTVKPFYYDWRQNVSTNAVSLDSKISSDTADNEKVDLVGHSMGGLVSRTYLESTDGIRLDKLLTAGSPHMGVPQTYAAWSGGDIWEDNFLIKTAMTLYLKHCAGLFSSNREAIQKNVPSVADMLPIFDYLQYNKSGDIKPVSSISAQNTWHSNNDFDAHGVNVETISGTGLSTLSSIQIKDQSKQDIKNGDWLDGKPAGKIYSYDGDHTVLASSSRLPGVPDVILNQNHEALVNSVDGMTEILRFLGTPPTTLNSTYSDPTSAIIIVGYPGNFWVTDENGNTQKDKNGMVSLINPGTGSYKINLIPQTNNTLFVVAQILPNGQTLYKEYRFEGYGPKFKTLKFNLDNPSENILN